MFYGPGGPYALFAGKDASRALAKMSFEPKDLTGDISGLGPFELEALQDWEYKFMSKYVKVGTVKKTLPVADASTGSTSETTKEAADTTDISSIDSQSSHAVESKESVQADHGAKSEHVVESEEDGPAGQADHGTKSEEDGPTGHCDEEERETDLKANTLAEHGGEADAAECSANLTEVSADGGTRG